MSHLIVIKWRAFTKVKVSVMLKKLSIIFLSLVIGVGTNLSSIYATNSKASIESWIDSEVAEYFSSIPRTFSSDNEQIKDYVGEEDSQDIVKTFENDELGVKGGIMKMVLNLDEEMLHSHKEQIILNGLLMIHHIRQLLEGISHIIILDQIVMLNLWIM